MPDMSMPADSPHTATTHPTPKPTEPEPTEPADTCPPSVLESVPAVGQLTSSLLSSVLTTTPVVSDLAGTTDQGQDVGPVDVSRGYARRPHVLPQRPTTGSQGL